MNINFLTSLDSNTTNIAIDIPTKINAQKITPGREKVVTLQKPV